MIVSDPILHEIVKGLLNYKYSRVKPILREAFKSNILSKNIWKHVKSDQEYFFEQKPYRADCVWFFERYDTTPIDKYYVVHEVKTGVFNYYKEIEKHSLGMNSQLWIWAWPGYFPNQTSLRSNTRLIPLTLIKPLIISTMKVMLAELEHANS